MLCAFLAGVLMAAVAACGQTEGTLQWAYALSGVTVSSPALSADGQTIYIGAETSGRAGRILAIPSNGGLPRWVRNRPQGIDASPTVDVDGTIYIGGYDGKFLALNPANGASRWELNVGAFITSTAAISDDGVIYFGAGDSQLWAVNRAGTVRWRFSAGSWIDSSPAIGPDGTVYFGCNDSKVYAVTREGVERWSFLTGGRIRASPAIGADGTIYVGSLDQRLYAFAPDGTKKWDYLANGEIHGSPTLGADGTIYFVADVNFYALKTDGTELWKRRINTTSASTAAVRADGVIILGADDGVVRAFNPSDGNVRWSYDTRTGTGNLIESSPIIAPDGSIYVGSLDGFLYKINGNGTALSTVSTWPAFCRDATRTSRATTLSGGGRLLNLSTRAQVGASETLIAGFVVQGGEERVHLLRGIGPTLGAFGLAGMPDPRLQVFSGNTMIASNDDWGTNIGGFSVSETAAAVGAFSLANDSKDAALVLPLAAGLYSTHITSADGRRGVTLVEAYDAPAGDPRSRLVNVSTRGQVGVGADSLFAGVSVGGPRRSRLLMRAIGPGLTQFGVGGVLARPTLMLFAPTPEGGQRLLGTNTGWTTSGAVYDLAAAARLVQAFPLLESSADCAMVVTVEPGNYTIQVSGVANTTGEALVEIYQLP
ncbi:MAG: PQQ-binding-like beta-propeller repeat protein [Opitutaceae bacterium]|nr:PQQ-binding-like beta-propeller repeat protein [Opitutaceae bacterium]